MKTNKHLATVFKMLLVLWSFVITPNSSVFAGINWPNQTLGTNAIVDALLAQCNGAVMQVDLMQGDGNGYYETNLYYLAWPFSLGSTRGEIQAAFDDQLVKALTMINTNDLALAGRWFRVMYSGWHKEAPQEWWMPWDVQAVFGRYYKFQLDDQNGTLRVPEVAYDVGMVNAVMNDYWWQQEELEKAAKIPRLKVGVVSIGSDGSPVKASAAAPILAKAISISVSGKPGSQVTIWVDGGFLASDGRKWDLEIGTITLDDKGTGVFLDKDALVSKSSRLYWAEAK